MRVIVRFIAVAILLAACGETHTLTDAGTGITFDAARNDGGFDAGYDAFIDLMGIGDACASDADCPGGTCIPSSGDFPGGYCTAECTSNDDCPETTTCLQLGEEFSGCVATCEPGADPRSCRAGYGCATAMFLPVPICLGGCTDSTDCAAGLECNPSGGRNGSGTCYNPAAMIGDACVASTECPSGGSCLTEEATGIPGGTCGVNPCEVEANTGCTGDAQCLPLRSFGRSLCVDGCETDDDCGREGLACVTHVTFPDRRYCGAGCTSDTDCSEGRICSVGTGRCDQAFDPDDLGSTCRIDDGSCAGGACLREVDSGFPGAYCVFVGCDPAMPEMSGCPGDGVCVESTTGEGLCLDGCESDAECTRAGYACRPSDLSDPESPTACRPACTADSQCVNDGFVCNDGTGLCLAPFVEAALGLDCTSNAECEGGRCVTEAASGWSAGMCTFPGCRLSGTGPSEPCPTDSTCVDDGGGDPELGVCVPSCPATSCRAGYACAAGACQPDCTAASCTDARTCNDASGLCE